MRDIVLKSWGQRMVNMSLPIPPEQGQTLSWSDQRLAPKCTALSEVQCPACWVNWRVASGRPCLTDCRQSPGDAVCRPPIGTVSALTASLTSPHSHQALCSFIYSSFGMNEYWVEIFLEILFSYYRYNYKELPAKTRLSPTVLSSFWPGLQESVSV